MPKIVSVKSIGKDQGYDLEVDHEDHQFYLENGLLTSNSHSDAYSVVTMQTAWLATYYPLEFYTAALTKAQANAIQTLIADILKTNIKVLSVDINKSKHANVIEDNSIRLAFNKIKGVGDSAVAKIVANAPYVDFIDFLDRSGAGKTAIEPLIMIGAFSSLPDCNNTKSLLEFYLEYCKNAKLKAKKHRTTLLSLYDSILKSSTASDFAIHEKVAIENELMEFNLAGSPFEILDRNTKVSKMFGNTTRTYQEFIDSDEPSAMLPVLVKDFKEKPQKNGQLFAFIKFATEDGVEFDAPAFANVWKHISHSCKRGSVYVVTFNREDEDPESLKVGRPGWAQSVHSATSAFIDIDMVQL